MRFLLDTHTFLWLHGNPSHIAAAVRDRLAEPSNDLLVSAITAMEAATKYRLGKLDIAADIVPIWSERLRQIGAADLALTAADAILAGSLNWPHRDPFDRMLAGQAMAANLTLVTADKVFRTLPGLKLLTW